MISLRTVKPPRKPLNIAFPISYLGEYCNLWWLWVCVHRCVCLYWILSEWKSKSPLRMSTKPFIPSFTTDRKTEIQVHSQNLDRVRRDYSENAGKEKTDSHLTGLLKPSRGLPALSSLHVFRTVLHTDRHFLRQVNIFSHDFYSRWDK